MYNSSRDRLESLNTLSSMDILVTFSLLSSEKKDNFTSVFLCCCMQIHVYNTCFPFILITCLMRNWYMYVIPFFFLLVCWTELRASHIPGKGYFHWAQSPAQQLIFFTSSFPHLPSSISVPDSLHLTLLSQFAFTYKSLRLILLYDRVVHHGAKMPYFLYFDGDTGFF